MEEAPENSEEPSYSANADGMNDEMPAAFRVALSRLRCTRRVILVTVILLEQCVRIQEKGDTVMRGNGRAVTLLCATYEVLTGVLYVK
jgi:hypothetical protein